MDIQVSKICKREINERKKNAAGKGHKEFREGASGSGSGALRCLRGCSS